MNLLTMPCVGLSASVSVLVFYLKCASVSITKNPVSSVRKSQKLPGVKREDSRNCRSIMDTNPKSHFLSRPPGRL